MKPIPFLPMFHDSIRAGHKTMTCRSTRYGEAGDVLYVAPGISIRIVAVARTTLGAVMDDCWKEEGCASPEAFRGIWLRLHRTFDPNRKVWAHTFEVI